MVFVKTWGYREIYKIECETRGNISRYYNLSYGAAIWTISSYDFVFS